MNHPTVLLSLNLVYFAKVRYDTNRKEIAIKELQLVIWSQIQLIFPPPPFNKAQNNSYESKV